MSDLVCRNQRCEGFAALPNISIQSANPSNFKSIVRKGLGYQQQNKIASYVCLFVRIYVCMIDIWLVVLFHTIVASAVSSHVISSHLMWPHAPRFCLVPSHHAPLCASHVTSFFIWWIIFRSCVSFFSDYMNPFDFDVDHITIPLLFLCSRFGAFLTTAGQCFPLFPGTKDGVWWTKFGRGFQDHAPLEPPTLHGELLRFMVSDG